MTFFFHFEHMHCLLRIFEEVFGNECTRAVTLSHCQDRRHYVCLKGHEEEFSNINEMFGGRWGSEIHICIV